MAVRKKKVVLKKAGPPVKSKDVPATQGMLWELRAELKSDMKSLERKMDSKFNRMESKFDKLMAEVYRIGSDVHRIALVVEDQNVRNKYALDGYTSLNDRLEKQEIEIAVIKKTIDSF